MPSRTQSRARGQSEAPEQRGVALVDPKEQSRKLISALDERRDQMAQFLASDPKVVDRFMSVAVDAITRSNDLLTADLFSLVASVRHAAIMGLEPTSVMGEGAIVAYRDRESGKKLAQFQPMVRGLRKLAMNSGAVSAIGVDVVREKDEFEFMSGSEPKIVHRPHIPGFGNEDTDSGSVVGAYAYARLVTGELVPLFMSSAEIQKRRRVAKTDSIWNAWPEEMAKKTVLRRLLVEKVPLSFRATNALALSDAIESKEGEPERVESTIASRTATRLLGSVDDTEQNDPGAPSGAPVAADASAPADGAPDGSTGVTDDEGEAREVCGKPGPMAEGQTCIEAPGHPDPRHSDKDGNSWL